MQSSSMVSHPEFEKTGTRATIAREAHHLRVVAGPGVVPVLAEADDHLRLATADCSIADIIAQRGRLAAEEVRGIGLASAHALGRVHDAGIVHGDLKPSNLLLRDGVLWLADFDAAGAPNERRRRQSPGRRHSPTLAAADDVSSLVHTLIECATTIVVDPAVSWSALDLTSLGCQADLAAELAIALRRCDEPHDLLELLDPTDARLPDPAEPLGVDATPTIDVSLDDWW